MVASADLQLVYFMASSAIKAAAARDALLPWTPASERNPPSDAGGGSGNGGSSSSRPGGTQPGRDAPATSSRDQNTMSGSSSRGARGGRPQAGSTKQLLCASSNSNSYFESSSVSSGTQHVGSSFDTLPQYDQEEAVSSSAALLSTPPADWLEAAAACIDIVHKSYGVIGTGASGPVFSYK